MAYIWALTDDGPVFLDSVFTWPKVTFGLQYYFLEVVLRVLTASFMGFTVWEASKGKPITRSKVFVVFLLTLTAFALSYAQNIPFKSFDVTRSGILVQARCHRTHRVHCGTVLRDSSGAEEVEPQM